jgi:hypothetical protein
VEETKTLRSRFIAELSESGEHNITPQHGWFEPYLKGVAQLSINEAEPLIVWTIGLPKR